MPIYETNYMEGNFKTTPFFIRSSDRISLETLGKKLSDYLYDINEFPSEGFFPFVDEDEYNENLAIKPLKLSNGLTVLPIRLKYDYEDERKREGLTQEQWISLPNSWKYKTRVWDMIIVEEEKPLVLLSSTWQTQIEDIKRRFFEHYVFTDNGIEIINSDLHLGSDIFKWMCYKYLRKNGILSSNLSLSNIKEIDAIIKKVKQGAVYTGNDVLSGLEETLLSLYKKRAIPKMSIQINYDGDEYQFTVTNDGKTFVSSRWCSKYGNLEKKLKNLNIVTDIYTKIIPSLISLYSNDKDWTMKNREEFEKWCGETIKKIFS